MQGYILATVGATSAVKLALCASNRAVIRKLEVLIAACVSVARGGAIVAVLAIGPD